MPEPEPDALRPEVRAAFEKSWQQGRVAYEYLARADDPSPGPARTAPVPETTQTLNPAELAAHEHEVVVASGDRRRLTAHVRGDSVTYTVTRRDGGGRWRVGTFGVPLATAVAVYNMTPIT